MDLSVEVWASLIVWRAAWSFLGGLCALLFWYAIFREATY